MHHWERLPTWWYGHEPCTLVGLTGGRRAGESSAALMVLLALGASAREDEDELYEVRATLSSLQGITGLARSVVRRGILRAQELGFIQYEPGGPRVKSRFTLGVSSLSDGRRPWAQLPFDQVRKKLSEMDIRLDATLCALKIYLVMLAARRNDQPYVRLSHSLLRKKTGAQTRQIRPALSMLANAGLIRIDSELDKDPESQKATAYFIVGLVPRSRSSQPAASMSM